MSKFMKVTGILALASGSALLLSACGGGGGYLKRSIITAQATIPSSVTARGTFTVNVLLTTSGNLEGTASVQLVDVGTVTPKIDCGPARTLIINGASGSFTCRAPQVNLGGNNTHQLQVNVNGVPNLLSPVAVTVVNGGKVVVKLTNTSGRIITTAAPGQTIEVAFSTATKPTGAGKYTVTAPSGWPVGKGGACDINGQSPKCQVPVTVAVGAASGSYAIKVDAKEDSSPLSANSLPISVHAVACSQTLGNYHSACCACSPAPPPMAFDLAQNISDTLYADSGGKTFKYQPVFLFKNTSGKNLQIASVAVEGLKTGSVKYGCNVQVSQKADYELSGMPACTLAPYTSTTPVLYAVSGNLPNSFKKAPSSATALLGAASIAINVLGSNNKTLGQHNTKVTFVKYVPGHVAVRVVNALNSTTVWVAAVYGANMVQFDASTHVGKISSAKSDGKFNAEQVALSKTGGLFYMPYGSGGYVYLTRGVGGFNTKSVPNVTGSPTPPAFLGIEMTYQKDVGPCPSSPCELLVVDQTYVNFISMLGSFNVMGNTAPLALNTEAATHGTTSDLTQSQIYQNIEKFFNKQGAPWAYDSANGTKNYIQKDSKGNITEILAPVQVFQVPSFNPMPENYYDTYVNYLWKYLEKTPIYVDASGTGISNSSNTTTSNDCVLKGYVVPPSSASSNAGKLVFSVSSGTCPQHGYAVAGAAPYNGSFCGHTGNQKANKACADTPDLVFSKFNTCDFISSAGGGYCHPVVDPTSEETQPQPIDPATFFENEGLWGPNGTYRAVVGRAIAAYQAAGLLPCAGTDKSKPMNAKNAHAVVSSGKAFENPSCLPKLTKPTWNVYAAALIPHVDVYTYTYGDFLGIDGTVTFAANALSNTLYQNLQVAQPVTVILH